MTMYGYPYCSEIKLAEKLSYSMKDLIRQFLEPDNYWKLRFSNDVLPLLDEGIKYIYVDEYDNPCITCYEEGCGEHPTINDDNVEIVNHVPNTLMSFNEYKSRFSDEAIIMVKDNYLNFINWYNHWNGNYYTCMDELKCKTYKIQCCSNHYHCGGKSYYEGWLCDKYSQRDLHNYLTWAGVDENPGTRTIDENGEFRVTIDIMDYRLSSLIKMDECLFISKRIYMDEFDISKKVTELRYIYNPIPYLISRYYIEEINNDWCYVIDDNVFSNYDKCIFQLRNCFSFNDGTKKSRRDALIITGYYTGVNINISNTDGIDFVWDQHYKNFPGTGEAYREYISSIISSYT